MMTNLTDKWKKGELPAGRYWVKYRNGGIDEWDLLGGITIETKPEITEVLAEVPSYKEWQDVKDDLATCDKDLNNVCEQKEELYEENEQLKELLKECRDKLDTYYEPTIKRINQVLGEE